MAASVSTPRGRLIAFIFLAGFLAAFCWSILSEPVVQIDFRVLTAAARVWARGYNPYDLHPYVRLFRLREGLPYLYPPDTLPLFQLFNLFPTSVAPSVFLAIKLVLVGVLWRLWQRDYLDAEDRWSPWFAAFCLFGFGSPILVDLYVGNVSLWEQALLWAGFAAYLRGRGWTFCVCIWCAAAFKLTLLAFSVLLLVDGPPGRQPLKFLLVWAAMAGRMAVNYLVSPTLFAEYVQALSGLQAGTADRSLNPATYETLRHLILRFAGEGAPASLLTAGYALVLAGVLAVSLPAYLALRRRPSNPRNDALLICLAVLTYSITVPRLTDYSCIILLLPMWVAVKTALAGRGYAWPAVVAASALQGHPLLPAVRPIYDFLWDYYLQIVLWIAWGLLVWHLRTTPVEPEPATLATGT